VAEAYGLPAYRAETMMQASQGLTGLFADRGPSFLSLEIKPDYQIVPQVRAGKLLQDADPALPREELERIMA
jgi:thiamine pyrophosphate-dependent acetolactate synthase large subunit-like protein